MLHKVSTEKMGEPITAYLHTNTVTLRQDQTAAEAMQKFRGMHISDKIVYLYVLGENDRLVGVVPVRRLLGSDPGTTMESIMVTPVVSIPSSSTVLEACEAFLNRRFLALPVVDDEGRLLGVVDLNIFTDDVLTSAHQQMDSAFQLVGVHVALGRRVSSWASFKDRFPWLLCNMTSGIICAFIASRFELMLSQVVVLAMFMTVVLALAESVSMQSMTITLQALMGRLTSWRHILMALRKELATSGLLGLGCGAVIGLTILIWRGRGGEAFAVGASIFLSVVTACLLGVAIPTAIHKLRIDPKVAAGPIVLAAADIATILFYLDLAYWILG